jgi:hypothetical protein
MMRALSVACLLVATTQAHADPSRAWSVAQAHLPASAKAVVGVDVDKAMASSLSAFAPPMIAVLGARATFESFKTKCKLDPMKAVDGLVIAEGAASDVGAYYLSLEGSDGFGKQAVTDCLKKLELDTKLTSVWLDDDVLVIPAKPTDKAMLATFTSGKGAFAKSQLGKLAAKTNKSAIWFASTKSRAVQGKTMKSGHGGLELANKTLTLSVEMTFKSANEASVVAKLVNEQIIALLASGLLDAVVMEMLNKVSVTTKGALLVGSGSIPDDQLMGLIGALTKPN